MYKSSMIVSWPEEDHAYIVSVPELQGCMAHGETREEALKEIEIAEALWLESAKDMDIEIPEPSHSATLI